jgi:hypothetical protein
MSKTAFIGNEEFLRVLIRSFHLNMSCETEENLVKSLYPHIEHTRQMSFKYGYDQGAFDEKMSWVNQGHED